MRRRHLVLVQAVGGFTLHIELHDYGTIALDRVKFTITNSANVVVWSGSEPFITGGETETG